MFENKSYLKIKLGSEKNFGFIFTIFFVVIGIYPLWYGNNIRFWSLVLAFIFLFITIFLSRVLIVPNKLWFIIGKLLGNIVSPIIILLLYFLTVTPIGIIMRLLGKDLISLKLDKSAKSYWIEREKSLDSMENQF